MRTTTRVTVIVPGPQNNCSLTRLFIELDDSNNLDYLIQIVRV